jgi:hypothetical protein
MNTHDSRYEGDGLLVCNDRIQRRIAACEKEVCKVRNKF